MSVNKARGRLERCELFGNFVGGMFVLAGGEATLTTCTLRDHPAGGEAYSGCGVYVEEDSKATVGADCFFARNAKGDVVRE